MNLLPRIACIVITCLGLALPAAANLRAPYRVDGAASSHVQPRADLGVELDGETMTVTFPPLTDKKFAPHAAAGDATVEIRYLLANRGARALVLPVTFLALGLSDLHVTVNGRALAWSREADRALERECLAVLARRRADAAMSNVRFGGDAVEAFARRDARELALARFSLPLDKGVSLLTLRYRQRLFAREGSPRYGAFNLPTSVLGFEYLLYPAKTWTRGAGFKFDLAIHVPDFVEPGTFRDRRFLPQVLCNLRLEPVYDAVTRSTRHAATFGEMPADVLSFFVRQGARR